MSEWDKLKQEMSKITADLSDIGFVIEWAKVWNKMESEGDRLQKDLVFWKEACAEMQAYKDGLYDKLEAIGEIMNPNHDPWKQLAEIREVLDGE